MRRHFPDTYARRTSPGDNFIKAQAIGHVMGHGCARKPAHSRVWASIQEAMLCSHNKPKLSPLLAIGPGRTPVADIGCEEVDQGALAGGQWVGFHNAVVRTVRTQKAPD